MSQIRLEIYSPDHLDLFDLSLDQPNKETLKANSGNFTEAYTIIIDSIPVMAIGSRIVKEGVAECWILRSAHMEKYKKFVVEATERLLMEFAKENNIKRFHTIVSENFVKWIEYMGFTVECELICFDEKRTFLYRRLM